VNHEDDNSALPISRRRLLVAAATGSAALAASGAFSTLPAMAGDIRAPRRGVHLVILGTAAGPPAQRGHMGIASVLSVEGHNYVIDCGRSAVTQYYRAGLAFDTLSSMFITHLHADHLADYYNFFMLEGWGPSGDGGQDAGIRQQIQVYGPGSAGELPPAYGGASVPIVAPQDPTPGLRALTERCHEAFAYSSNIFIRDSGSPDVRTLVQANDIVVPDVGSNALGDTAPSMQPFPVMEDDRVRVTAVLVPHGPVYPSFAFRFDTDAGSVVFSGDTRRTDNVVRLAEGADILVHEALDLDYYHSTGASDAQISHLETSHTPTTQVGDIAESAGVKTLVLSHLAPGSAGLVPDSKWISDAKGAFSGRVFRAHELQTLAVGQTRPSA
jgi:ribonuclease BN (tRNA processing enzyme)